MSRPLALVLTALLALPACSGDDELAAGHSHADGAMVSLPVGDGTESSRVGYELVDVSLPTRAGTTGQVSFRVLDADGGPVTQYLEELTKDLHLYVVREDLSVFRHLHPTMAEDGTWSAPVMLPTSGTYRVIAEFVAEDSGGNGDHLVLGEAVAVAAGPADDPAPADPAVQVEVTDRPVVSPEGRMELTVRDEQDRPVRLETYLGVHGHVTGFHRESGAMLHMHPLTTPDVTEDGSALQFHTEISEPGDYLMFVQVRVDGLLHTVPVEVEVPAPSA